VRVHLDPVHRSDRRRADVAAALRELLKAVLVVERGIPLPGRLERVRERSGGASLDQRDADVLSGRSREGRFLADLRDGAVVREDDLHLLGSEGLHVVEREEDVRSALREQRLLDAHGVDGVAVGHEHAVRERLARKPERVRVVPLVRAVVVDEVERDPVPAFEVVHLLPDAVGGEADHEDDVAEPHLREVREGQVEDRPAVRQGKERFRERRRQGVETASRPRCEDQALHSPPRSAGAAAIAGGSITRIAQE
jgi:hypothetical protein